MTTHIMSDAPALSGPSHRLRALLREWRAVRRVSQLALALDVGVSQRHLSFIESGRTRPSREMVLRLATALDLPLRARNELLVAAGFAPVYPERALSDSEMAVVRGSLDRLLTHHEPYPAMVLDRWWNIVLRNAANTRIISGLADEGAVARESPDGKLNFVRLMFSPAGLRPHIVNWETAARGLIVRVRREAASNPGSPSQALLEEFGPFVRSAPTIAAAAPDDTISAVIPIELEVRGARLALVNLLTTFGTPQDVAVQELRVEMGYPANAQTDALLRQWAAEAGIAPSSASGLH